MVPARLSALTKCNQTAKVLDEQLLKIKQHISTMKLKHKKKELHRKLPIPRI